MAIQTVIFDLGRTLIPFSLEPLQPHIQQPPVAELCRRFEAGGLAPAAFQAELCRLTAMPAAAFAPWWNAIFEPEWLLPPAYIRGLMGRFRMGLLSNTNPIHFEYLLHRHPLLGEFDFHTLSHEVGAAKPEAGIYAAAEAAAGCAPQEILYFDDVAEFVAAAGRRGWQAHQFTGPEAVYRAVPQTANR